MFFLTWKEARNNPLVKVVSQSEAIEEVDFWEKTMQRAGIEYPVVVGDSLNYCNCCEKWRCLSGDIDVAYVIEIDHIVVVHNIRRLWFSMNFLKYANLEYKDICK
ncbi:MAG: hypothetical protein WC022_00965 [Parcubacteria group bacterium]